MGLLEPVIPVLATLENPVLEWSSYEGKNDVANIASGHLADLSYYRERIDYILIAEAEVQDSVHREFFILRHSDDLHLLVEDGLEHMRSMIRNLPFSWRLPSP